MNTWFIYRLIVVGIGLAIHPRHGDSLHLEVEMDHHQDPISIHALFALYG